MLKTKFPILLLTLALVVAGCTPSTPETTATEKKAFLGGPMPKDFMKQNAAAMQGAQAAAQKAQAKDMANRG